MLPPGEEASSSECEGDHGVSAEQQQRPLECGYYDVEQVNEISQLLLLTLGTACVEKTYGDLFNTPASVLPDVKNEIQDYLLQHPNVSSSSLHSPSKIIGDDLDGFVHGKRSFFNRVSSKIISSEKKEDRIEEFVQEIDKKGLWMIGHREGLAKTLLRVLDDRGVYICQTRFQSIEELAEHKRICPLRPITCVNDGCGEVFSAKHAESHDAICPFKLLSCEQNCKALVMRGDMDKHCVTVCSMKLVNCPFYQVGCADPLPQGAVEQHCVDFMGPHLLSVLQFLQKQEISMANVAQRVLLLEKAVSINQRSEAVDVGNLMLKVREQEAKIKALEQEIAKSRKASDISAEVREMHNELRNLQKEIGTRSIAK